MKLSCYTIQLHVPDDRPNRYNPEPGTKCYKNHFERIICKDALEAAMLALKRNPGGKVFQVHYDFLIDHIETYAE